MEQYTEEERFVCINQRITELPGFEKTVKYVDVRRNRLRGLAFDPCNCIEYLDASDNLIGSMECLHPLKNVRILDCSYNVLTEIPRLDLPLIRELYLISNDIGRVEHVEFPLLEKVDMANNFIERLENLDSPSLQEVYMASNKITEIQDLTHLKKLRILDLQYNKLETLDCSLLPSSIEVLLVQNNTSLREIAGIHRLKSLKLLGIKNTLVDEKSIQKEIGTELNVEIW